MSYILDALKKAESDRLSGAAPIIGAPVERFLAREAPRRRPWLRTAVPLAAAAASALVWFTVGQEQEAARPAPIVAHIEPPAAKPARSPSPMPRVAPPVKKPAAPERKVRPAITKPTPKTSVAEHKPAPPPQAEPIQEVLPFLHELSAQVQREIPKFSIGGYLYSNNKADRSLLVNRRLLHEGDQISPGLVIEEMRPQEMVLNYQGTRYRSNY